LLRFTGGIFFHLSFPLSISLSFRVSEYLFAARPARIVEGWGNIPREIAGINRAPRQPKGTRIWAPGVLRALIRPGVLGYPDWVFSVSCAGRSQFPAPGVLGFLISTEDFDAGRACYPETYTSWPTSRSTNCDILTASDPTSGSLGRMSIRDWVDPDRTRLLSTARLPSRFPFQRGPDKLGLS